IQIESGDQCFLFALDFESMFCAGMVKILLQHNPSESGKQAKTQLMSSPNFTALDMSLPEVAILVAAMGQGRDAGGRRSWSHPQEPTGEEWWADVLADPRARRRERRTDLAVKQAFHRLADEKRDIILVACSKCDWRAAFSRDELIASHGADYAMP